MTTPEPETANYLKRCAEKPALITLGLIGAVTVGVALIMALSLITALMISAGNGFSTGGLGTILSLLGTVMAGLLGAGWSGNGGMSLAMFNADGSMVISLFSLTTLVLIVVGTAIVARRRLAHDELAPTLAMSAARAAIEGAAVGLVFALALGFVSLQSSSVPMVQGNLHGRPFTIFLTLFVVITSTLIVTRERTRASSAVTTFLARPLIAETRLFFTATLIVVAPLVVVFVILASVQQSVGMGFAAIPFFINILLAIVSMGYLGGVAAEVPFAGTELLMPWQISVWFTVLVFVFAALGILAASISVGLHRPRAAKFRAEMLWRLPVGAIIVWFAIVLVALPVRLSAGMDSLGTMKLVITLSWWAPFTAAVAALIASVLAEFSPRWLYLAQPQMLRFFASKATIDRWLSGRVDTTYAAKTVDLAAPVATSETPAATSPEPTSLPAPAPATLVAEPSEVAEPTVPAEAEPVADAADTVVLPDAAPIAETLVAETLVTEAPVADAADAGGDDPLALPERTPLSPEKKRRIIALVATAVALVAVVAAGFITVKVMNAQRGPETAVSHYLSLIEKGKIEAATKAADPGVRNAERGLLTKEVYGATDHHIEVLEVSTLDGYDVGDSRTAVVEAGISVDGEHQIVYFEAVRDNNSFGVLHNWRVTTPLVQPVRIEAPFEFDTIEIGDTSIKLDKGSIADDWGEMHVYDAYLYPGEYTLSIPNSEYTEFEAVTVTVLPQQSLSTNPQHNESLYVTIEANASEALQKAVLELVNAEFTKCVTIPTNMEDFCPYVTQDKDLAVLELGSLPDGFEEFGATSFETNRGTVKTQRNSTEWSDYDLEETEVAMNGSYTVTDGKVTISDVWSTTSFWSW